MFLVSDVRLYREALVEFLGRDVRFTIVGQSEPDRGALALLSETDHDIVLINPTFPEAPDYLRQLREVLPATRVVAFSLVGTGHELLHIVSAGVSGCVGREGTTLEIAEAILAALRDEFYCSGRIIGALVHGLLRDRAPAPSPEPAASLTSREKQIAVRIRDGLTNKQIAADLAMSPATVKNHIHRILSKLQVSRRVQIASAWRRP